MYSMCILDLGSYIGSFLEEGNEPGYRTVLDLGHGSINSASTCAIIMNCGACMPICRFILAVKCITVE